MSSVQRVAPFESRVAVGLGGGLLGFTFTVLGLLFLISARLDGFLVVAFLVPVLLAASWPAFTRQARRERDPSLVNLLVAALLLKLFGSLVRYWVAVAFYDSNADAFEYHRVGVDLAMRFRAGNFDTGLASLSGTDFISFFTGIVYTITGPSIFAGFLLYSWLAFGGMFYLYRAFTIAIPDGRKRSYARLLFFMPSMLYWRPHRQEPDAVPLVCRLRHGRLLTASLGGCPGGLPCGAAIVRAPSRGCRARLVGPTVRPAAAPVGALGKQ